jgi:hypothetical protein
MVIDSNENFTRPDRHLSDDAAAKYLHEYVHFLQDVSTTAGLVNMVNQVDYLKQFNQDLLAEPSGIDVPYELKPSHGATWFNYQMRRKWIGGGKHLMIASLDATEEVIELVDGHPVRRVKLSVTDQNDNNLDYFFGTYCISESMAYEIETAMYPGVLPKAPDMPYTSVRLVAEFLLPKVIWSSELIIALCDASMMFPDAGHVLYTTLLNMKTEGFIPTNEDAIYDYVNLKLSDFTDPNTGLIGLDEIFHFYSHICNVQLADYFGSNVFKHNFIWVTKILSMSSSMRTIRGGIFQQLLDVRDVRSDDFARKFYLRFGSPLITNNQNEVFFVPNLNPKNHEIEPVYFWVFQQILELVSKDWDKILSERSTLCALFDFCNKDKEESEKYTDHRCRVAPWERANDPDPQLCYFGAVWKAWGHQGKELIEAQPE